MSSAVSRPGPAGRCSVVTRLVAWVRDPRRCKRHGGTEGRSLGRDRRPRLLPGVSRYGTLKTYAWPSRCSMADPSRSRDGDGRAHQRTTPGRPYQVSTRTTGLERRPRDPAARDRWNPSEDVVSTNLHGSIEAE